MQIPGLLSASARSAWHKTRCCGIFKKLTMPLSAVASMLVLHMQIPNAYAHVSHVLSDQQYADIKSGYPDIEIIAAGMTGLVAFSAILVQSLQKCRRRLERC